MRVNARILTLSSFSRVAIERSSRSSRLEPMTDTETRVTDGAGVFAGVRAKDRRDGGENIVAAEIEAARIRDIFGTGGFELDRRDRSGESPE